MSNLVNLEASLEGSSLLGGHLIYDITSTLSGSSSLLATATLGLGGYAAPVRYQEPARVVKAGKMVLENVDLFLSDGKTRVIDVPISDLQLKIFCNSNEVSWPLVSGTGINDIQVVAGNVYWTEISSGFYTIRFFPSVLDLWRLILTYRSYDQAISFTYDVVQLTTSPLIGIKTSFYRNGE